jgi:arylformamidase
VASSGRTAWRDISVAFDTATPPWPGDTPFACGWALSLVDGGSVNLSKWELSPHIGTHADAPLHVQRDGAGADQLPLAPFLGEAVVVDARDQTGPIDLATLEARGAVRGVERLLLQTGRSTAAGKFPAEWPALEPEAARALAGAGLLLLGVDAPSVDDRESKTLGVHRALFGGGAFVLENLDLRGVGAGRYELLALPLRTGAVDAAPARAFLRALA